jgi:hypothetical protein
MFRGTLCLTDDRKDPTSYFVAAAIFTCRRTGRQAGPVDCAAASKRRHIKKRTRRSSANESADITKNIQRRAGREHNAAAAKTPNAYENMPGYGEVSGLGIIGYTTVKSESICENEFINISYPTHVWIVARPILWFWSSTTAIPQNEHVPCINAQVCER